MQSNSTPSKQKFQAPLVPLFEAEPDYSQWLPLLRCLFQSYRRDLPALRAAILEELANLARDWEG